MYDYINYTSKLPFTEGYILITCSRYSFQNVDETVQRLNKRFNLHKTGYVKHRHCKILSDHFTKGICEGVKYRVQIIAKVEENVRNKRGAKDPSFVPKRKAKETEWMKTLRTVYEYGMNDKVGDELQPIKTN